MIVITLRRETDIFALYLHAVGVGVLGVVGLARPDDHNKLFCVGCILEIMGIPRRDIHHTRLGAADMIFDNLVAVYFAQAYDRLAADREKFFVLV